MLGSYPLEWRNQDHLRSIGLRDNRYDESAELIEIIAKAGYYELRKIERDGVKPHILDLGRFLIGNKCPRSLRLYLIKDRGFSQKPMLKN